MSERTFKVQVPPMKGEDVQGWQEWLDHQMRTWHISYRIKADGIYGVTTRDMTAKVCHGLGIKSTKEAMRDGVTPQLRTKLRNKRLSPAELARYALRQPWREALRSMYADGGRTAPPLAKILASSWGYHPGVHDGVDLICSPNATIYALCDARVIDARSSGWWGKAPSGDVSKGDGIIQLECHVDVGPFKRGLHFGYGHAEHAIVKPGQIVKAGEPIGKAGLAVAWHVHFMCNGGQTTKGIGDRDPMPYVTYALRRR